MTGQSRGALALTLVLAACAGPADRTEEAREADTPLPGQSACFLRDQVQDFDPLDRGSLIVYAPSRRNAYLVKISPPSSALRSAQAIAFESRSSQVCGRAGERVLLGRGALNYQSVIDVRRLAETELAELLEGYGRSRKSIEPELDTQAEIEALETNAYE